ncbi:MAG: SAM-dependent methyltransferase [Verrucomicrobiota bacterium]|jgi:hypothetical protein
MPFDFHRARPLLQTGDLTRLFVEGLGWEPCRQQLTLRAGETDYAFTAVAEKRGFTAWLCTRPEGCLPDHTTRLKLDRALTQTSFEHLIVFATREGAQQSWMWVRREPGRPLSARTHEFNRAQPGDSLLQKLQILYVSLEEEEKGELSTVTIAGRARAAFDIERVTKAFYRDFDTHRKAFLKFIEGITEVADREWYASVMLNRLMFVYFIQRKGFLDADPDYLRNRLHRCQQEKGKDKFYTFYRYFLLRLFHEGFAKRRKDRAPDLERLLGNIPYLNGGLFDIHELEKPERYGQAIQIPDQAFERVFDYFDQYQWHLDERPLRADNEINPDVLGYIFEKYINQKQMGAYYTKEDITEYISKSTVIPFLFDAARAKCKVAFDGGAGFQPAGSGGVPAARSQAGLAGKMPAPLAGGDACPTVWDLLREHPDRYIYPAVRHGMDKTLPPEIAAGLDASKPDLIERRKAWNKPAPGDCALPTEIWREVVARRQRYWEVWSRLSGRQANPDWVASPPGAPNISPARGGKGRGEGEPSSSIRDINDFITLNLDLRQFAQDVIQSCEGPDLLMAFWQAITTITVLDPTGGSGAFIFAALNILEPLYEACLDRMEAFLAEWGDQGRKLHPNYHRKFTEVLARVDAHSNRRYFVLKSIILNNLYAVDIMEEAVEICKLRLFLKLAAQVEPEAARDNLGIEPLPDIDFNIRAGNTLVGYAAYDEVKRAVTSTLDFENAMGKIAVKAADLQQTFDKFRQLQTEGDGSVPAADKEELQKRLKTLEDELNRHLAGEYGVKTSDKGAYAEWLKSHQPFHWFVEFYGILNSGGFDAIIGNPPYVEYKDVKKDYLIKGYATEACGNLYAFTLERCVRLVSTTARAGLIVPLSFVATERMKVLQEFFVFENSAVWFSLFDVYPTKLFDGGKQRLTVVISARHGNRRPAQSTRYNRWYQEERDFLFQGLSYTQSEYIPALSSFPKYSGPVAKDILLKVSAKKPVLFVDRANKTSFYVHRIPYNFVKAVNFVPYFWNQADGEKRSEDYKPYCVNDNSAELALLATLNSSLFFWWWYLLFEGYHCGKHEIFAFPFGASEMAAQTQGRLNELALELMRDFQANKHRKECFYANTGKVIYDEFFPRSSKKIIDEIDRALARHYCLTDEELDYILSYDIKYRLGREAEAE